MNRIFSCLAISALVLGTSPTTVATDVKTVLVHTVSFDQTVEPRGLLETLNDVVENPEVVWALSVVAAYYGIPKEAIKTGAAVISALTKDATQEERAYEVRPPHGYVLCKVVILKNEKGNPDGSIAGRGHFGARVVGGSGRGLKVSIWTKRGQVGKGRSWIHIPVQLHFLSWEAYKNRDFSDRHCQRTGTLLADFYWNNWKNW